MCGGWADRLKGILSTYAFSLIMNRHFLIRINQGCDLIKILHPNKINWHYDQTPRATISTVLIKYEWKYWVSQKIRSEKELLKKYSDTNLIRIKSGFMFSDSLAKNPFYKKIINDLGYEQSKFKIVYQFRKWYGELFKLNQKLQLKYENLVSSIKPRNTKLICIQIRTGDPKHVTESGTKITLDFWNFVKTKFLESTKYLNTNFSIYVTADREFVKKEAKEYFPNHPVFYIEDSSVHVEKQININKCLDMENVLLDFHFMQNCDIGVVSHSGFGIMSMWNRPDPLKNLYVYTQKDQKAFVKNYYNRKNLTFVKFSKLNDIFFV
ncbi:hypothetical protein BpHYR1_007328 [Brachionus plicatilis]|uniref:L-Fucosyltransferase n=1 Tax=Brachionus plicatilis TaxID=10195 RepID=A0A3M7RZL6_BRAPC|nr:hypothetical protein BpHYR1_007328 [Brachionus plicatilis]